MTAEDSTADVQRTLDELAAIDMKGNGKTRELFVTLARYASEKRPITIPDLAVRLRTGRKSVSHRLRSTQKAMDRIGSPFEIVINRRNHHRHLVHIARRHA